tara:strand:+ start:94 stop:276 length:183 start_codon:yes stop_codon:yes gene_type:complete
MLFLDQLFEERTKIFIIIEEISVPINSLILTTNMKKSDCDKMYKEWLDEFFLESARFKNR